MIAVTIWISTCTTFDRTRSVASSTVSQRPIIAIYLILPTVVRGAWAVGNILVYRWHIPFPLYVRLIHISSLVFEEIPKISRCARFHVMHDSIKCDSGDRRSIHTCEIIFLEMMRFTIHIGRSPVLITNLIWEVASIAEQEVFYNGVEMLNAKYLILIAMQMDKRNRFFRSEVHVKLIERVATAWTVCRKCAIEHFRTSVCHHAAHGESTEVELRRIDGDIAVGSVLCLVVSLYLIHKCLDKLSICILFSSGFPTGSATKTGLPVVTGIVCFILFSISSLRIDHNEFFLLGEWGE